MNINQDIIERIFKAADELFEEGGRKRVPTVDTVRRLAQVNMNDASACMKDWRKKLMAQAASASVVSIPEEIQRTQSSALAQLWLSAQTLANEALQAEKDRLESISAAADELRIELSHAYDSQGAELTEARKQIESLESTCTDVQKQLKATQARFSEEKARSDQLTQQVEGLQEGITEAKTERVGALKEASAAREAKARLEGQLEAVQQQNTELMAAVRPIGKGAKK